VKKIKSLDNINGRELIKALILDQIDDSIKEEAVKLSLDIIDKLGETIDRGKQAEEAYIDILKQQSGKSAITDDEFILKAIFEIVKRQNIIRKSFEDLKLLKVT